nr:cyclase family protein [Rubrobacter calidifluminis]
MSTLVNFIDDAMRRPRRDARPPREGVLAVDEFRFHGPQKEIMGRSNPVHTMPETGDEAMHGRQDFPHGIGGVDDVIFVPLQRTTHWAGLGHIFDRGLAYNGRPADEVVVSAGDLVTGIENVAADIVGRGALLDFGHAIGEDGELNAGFAITEEHIHQTIERRGPTSVVGRGDPVLARIGQLSRCQREGWGHSARGDAPEFSFSTARWLHRTEMAAIATDTRDFELRPLSSRRRSRRCTRSSSRTWALLSVRCSILERWPKTAPEMVSTSSFSWQALCLSPGRQVHQSIRWP